MIVMAIIGILLTIAQPNLRHALIKAREAVLKEDLFQIRDAIDQYYADNGKYPAQLTDLVNQEDKAKSYLRDIPKDPFTGAQDWVTVSLEGEETGIFDVHSASPSSRRTAPRLTIPGETPYPPALKTLVLSPSPSIFAL